jgi:hypothetical protein
MKPTLEQMMVVIVREEDPVVAESALSADIELFEGVARTFADDPDFLLLASEARATHAFVFLEDRGEGERASSMYRRSRILAELALRQSDDYFAIIGERALEEVPLEELSEAVTRLERRDARGLFLAAFSWAGTLVADAKGADPTTAAKLAAMSDRVLGLDPGVYFDFGGHLLRGRVAAIEGRIDVARRELGFAKAEGLLIGEVLRAELEDDSDAERRLRAVIDAEPRVDRVLFESAARRRACLDLRSRFNATIDRCKIALGGR